MDAQNAHDSLQSALQDLGQKLTATIQRILTDVTTLDVTTYVSSDMSAMQYDAARDAFSGAVKPWAKTIMKLDGDISNCFQEGELDPTLLAMHKDMVQQALKQRADMLKTISAVAKEVLSMLRDEE